MKLRLVIIVVMYCSIISSVDAQYLNIQHHLDWGENRHYFTNTLEGLAFDDLGAWFGFIDVDHKSRRSNTAEENWRIGAQLIYFEINRYFSLEKMFSFPWAKLWDFTIQYNDSDVDFIPAAYLIGVSRNHVLTPFLDAHLEFLLRKEAQQALGWQITGVWFKQFHISGLDWQFLGYFDLWKNDLGKFFMAEPQIVFNLQQLQVGSRFWLGTEWEINLGEDPFQDSVNPTLFLRYDF